VIFSSSIFLVYFLPIVLALYLIIPNYFKNAFLLVASILFYSWGAPEFIVVILITTALDFYLVQIMASSTTEFKRKLFLILSISLNLGLLTYFKYCNFFIDNLNGLLSFMSVGELKWVNVVLPIGISFYTFESITYVVDVYRKEHKPLTNFFQYQLYILFFPKLIAGPIVRFSEIADQITGRFDTYKVDVFLSGAYRFVIGLAKKVLIANVIAKIADEVFALPVNTLSSFECWVGALAYTFQIYFDFSGYSDMAIGLGKMFGFNLPENFNNPYTSRSITEFWQCWHITLGNWMKNYLYIPLGGNKVTTKRLYINLAVVFVLSGLWHGASWTFVLWGVYYGCWLVIERMFLLQYFKKIGVISWLITFFIVVIGWVFFRANSVEQSFSFIGRMFQGHSTSVSHVFLSNKIYVMFSVSLFFSFFIMLPFGKKLQEFIFVREERSLPAHLIMMSVALCLFTLSLASITSSDFNPFIYFRF